MNAPASCRKNAPLARSPNIRSCAQYLVAVELFNLRPRHNHAAKMRLTTDLINNSLSFINCLTERELDLRGAYGKNRCYT